MNTAYVTAGKPKPAGAVFCAPLGTALPTTADSALPEAWKDLGYISEDGVTNSNSPSSETIKDWGGRVVLTVSTEKPDTFTLKYIEAINPDVAKVVYGADNVTLNTTTGYTLTVNANAVEHYSYVIDVAMTGGALKRIVIPEGSLTEVGDIVYKSDEATGYEVTMEALPDASGNNHYEYIKFAS